MLRRLDERKPSPQEMNIFEQQEMSKSRPQVMSKLNDWYDWLVNHVPKTIKDGASRAFKTFKDRIMGLYNRVTGNQAQLKGSPSHASAEPKPFNEIEREFGGAYRSYRINGRPKMDVDTFFIRMREGLIELTKRELNDLNSARIQMTRWIRFARDKDRVELVFNSRMTNVHQESNLDQIVDGMIAHMKTQIENPALLNSRFRFIEVLFLDISFHQLNLTRGNLYLLLPDLLARKKAIINPQNNDEECFKWAVIAVENFNEISKNPQRLSNLRTLPDNYDWSGLKFPVAIKDINIFEMNDDISVNVLSVEHKGLYICRKGIRKDSEINLMLISERDRSHYTSIKSLSRLLASKNSKHAHEQYFCTNCLQGFAQELSRDEHQVYCEDNETVGVEMPRKESTVEFLDEQNQFKVPFIMYTDFESILEPIQGPYPDPKESYTSEVTKHSPSG